MIGQKIIQMQSVLASKRSNFDSIYQEVAQFVMPNHAVFTSKKTQGEETVNRIFDTTAIRALNMYVSLMNTMLTPRNRQWHKLQSKSPTLKDDPKINAYLEKKTKEIFALRYAPDTNFSSQMDELYKQDGCFGTGALFVDTDEGKIRYKNIPLNQIFIMPNHQGIVDYVHRVFKLTAQQVVEKFKGESVPEGVLSEVKDIKNQKEHTIIHCVKKNPDFNPRQLSPNKMRFISYYVLEKGEHILQEGGYRVMPYIINRHSVSPEEDYGRSPAIDNLPLIKMLNEKERLIIRTSQNVASPPLIATALANVGAFQMVSGAMNPGYLKDGVAQIQPFNTGARIDISVDLLERDKKSVESAFFVNLFQILIETPNMTATEVLQRAQEKAQLLAPTMGRKQSELLGPLIEREIDIFARLGLFDDIPQELAQSPEGLDIIYDTEMTRAMRADEGVGIMRTLEVAMQAAQVDQSVMDIFNLPQAMRELSTINGMPAKILRTDDEIKAIQDARQEQQEAMQATEMAKNVAPMVGNIGKMQ